VVGKGGFWVMWEASTMKVEAMDDKVRLRYMLIVVPRDRHHRIRGGM
jgi:hypothetical protein